MPKRKVIYVGPNEGGNWSVKGQRARRALKNFENKNDAINFGRKIAKNADLGQLKIQKRDGTFQREYTYGKDPYPPEG
jgi:hypothetical protein